MNKKKILYVIVTVVLLTVASAGVRSETQVVFTVDVESTEVFPLPSQVDAVCTNGSACGLMEMVRMLQERRMAGTFFLNVYEYQSWGEAAMRDIAVKLQAAGQDVALHTHPQWIYDPLRWAMYEYSLEEQTSIIRDGAERLAAWTGHPVVAHRAGAYTADENTLKALERNGLRVDSSLFWGNPHSRINELGLPRNLPSFPGRLIEIPITVYHRQERPHLLGDFLAPVTSIRKIDADWFYDEAEARAAVDAVVAAELPYLVVFLHSFSFLEAHGGSRALVADLHTRDMFRVILDHVAELGLRVVTMRDLAKPEAVIGASKIRDTIPKVSVLTGLHRYLWHRLRGVERRALYLSGAGVLGLVAGGVVFVIVTHRRGRASAGTRA